MAEGTSGPNYGAGDWVSTIEPVIEMADPDQLLAHELNARRHPGEQRDALRASLNEVGWIAPVIVNRATNKVLDGHARVEEAISRDAKVPVVYVNVPAEQEKFVLATFDPITTMAHFDEAALTDLLVDLETTGVAALDDLLAGLADLELGVDGFGLPELESLPDEGPSEPPVNPTTKVGDVWLLGDHRLICGDSSDRNNYPDEPADALITDPPYGVDYGDTVKFRRSVGYKQRAEDDSHVSNDGLEDALDLWDRVFPVAIDALGDRSAFYIWGSGGPQMMDLGNAIVKAGGQIHGSIIWVKSGFSFSRADHKYQHELAFYGWPSKSVHDWHGENNESSVWNFDRPAKSEWHPTQKPLELMVRCVRNITERNDLVLEPFAGSGTTLLACEQTNRRCHAIELEPGYCDVICERFQAATGIDPVLESSGVAYDFVGETNSQQM